LSILKIMMMFRSMNTISDFRLSISWRFKL